MFAVPARLLIHRRRVEVCWDFFSVPDCCSRCCFCWFCVEDCPEDAIRMDTGEVELARYSRGDLVYDLEKLVG